MIAGRFEVADAQLDSVLGRTSPIVKLAIALLWLIGLAFTLHPVPPVVLAVVVLVAGLVLGGITPANLLRTLDPAVAGGAGDRRVEHAVLGGQRRSDDGRRS